ncbi:NACHT domain-containing protein [Streptomyces fildesensis]|uniref:NACHT domain-containing protein n=1 Tax=Streptomyces fildesensis TaxID=375757 RepID=A0ABW8C296_9ACTN
MSRAGQAGEVGSVFRCAVATHLAVHGLRSRSVSGLDLPEGVDPIRLDFETEEPTDDIRVTFSDGRRAYVSAKRRVTKGRPLEETVTGWVGQAPRLEPEDLLVIAGESFAGPAKDLDRVLRRHRAGLRMETKEERDAFDALDVLLPVGMRELVLGRARVLNLPDSTGAAASRDLLAALMDHVVLDDQGQRGVAVLADLFHRQAGEAIGSDIDAWVMALNNAGLTVIADRGGPAGMRVASRLAAVSNYRARLKADSGRLDLSLLAEDLPALAIDDLIDGLKIDIEGSRTPEGLLPNLRRWRRMLVVGQPGSGKSVALREIAAHCVTHPHAPVPVRVSLPRLMKQQPERLTIDGIIDGATSEVARADQRAPLAEYLTEELASGRAIVLCDGLDECGARAPWVAHQLAGILGTLHPRVGFVLATRANAQTPAARLGLPRVELAPPDDLIATVDRILVACAEERVSESDREAWLATRRAWIRDAKDQHEHLLAVPLLAILLVLICASASDADLPRGRATLLHRAVEQSVQRWEQTRGTLDPTRPWLPVLTAGMLLGGFIVLGRILDGGATPPRAEALESLAEMLKDPEQWAMPPARAREASEQVLRFWDEHVAVFVVNAADELTTRSKVFAEIATAMWASACEQEQLTGWLSEALIHTDSDGAIALAAGLDSRAVKALLEVGDTGRTEAILMVVDLATRGIVTLGPDAYDRTLSQLTAGAVVSRESGLPAKRGPRNPPTWFPTLWDETRGAGPWPFVQAACQLALPDRYRGRRANLVAEAALDDRSQKIAAALCELTDATTDDRPLAEAGAAAVNAALAIPLPPGPEMVQESRRRYALVSGGRLAPGLDHVALAAASRLDELMDDADERMFQIAMHASGGTADGIFAGLSRAGIDVSRRWNGIAANMRNWFSTHKEYRAALLADLSSLAHPVAILNDDSLWSLTDIGDLLAATGYHDVGASEFGRAFVDDSPEHRRRWLDAMADAYGIDKSAVASQASYLQRMIEETNGTDSVNEDWWVVSTRPLASPPLSTSLDKALTTDQQQILLLCLEANSDWIAWAAAVVLVNMKDPQWSSQELFEKNMAGWRRSRAGLAYMVAILAAGSKRTELLTRAAASDSADYRYAACRAISIASWIDADESIMKTLCRDADLSVRPKAARKALPAPTHWSCGDCKAINDVDVEDCSACSVGVRPDS